NAELKDGNVAAARLYYRKAIEEGLASAALALAATYDATELAKLKIQGVPAEPEEAKRWYDKARQMGALPR
ncbi:MAG: sel1 repeat family protein, partial [Proteobacteria bacterium]|nr:sel1 repeat family protein [Pseudomonadota bacterium]